MKNTDRQLVLNTRMHRNRSFGKEPYCSHCWAKCNGCLATGKARSKQILCVKAYDRMKGQPTPTPLEELIRYAGERERHYLMRGLRKEERWNEQTKADQGESNS